MFCIHQWQVVHDLTKSVHLSGTLAVLHQMAVSAVINIEGHDLCGNFNFLIRDPLLQQLEALLRLQLCCGSVRRPPG